MVTAWALVGALVGCSSDESASTGAIMEDTLVDAVSDVSAPDTTTGELEPLDVETEDVSEPNESMLDDIWLGRDMTADGQALFAMGHQPAVDLYLDADIVTSLGKAWNETVEGHVWIDGRPLFGVGVTLVKTEKTVPDVQGKPRIWLTFDHVDPEQTFQGYRGLWLHAMTRDPSKLREVLGFELFRESGLPAPHSTHAWLRINGEDRGLYNVVEPYGDPQFIARHDPDPEAPVYAASGKMDLVADQVDSYQLVHGSDPERAALTALVAGLDTIEETQPEDVLTALAAWVDLDDYLTFVATEVMLGHKTGYGHGPVRYALTESSDDGLWRFIPVGLDRSFKGLNALNAKGRIHQICMDNLSCRWAYVSALEAAAQLIDELKLAERVDMARPYILAMAQADPFIEDVTEIESALNHAESYFASNPGWVLANLECVDPTFVDKDGDGYNGCGEDCDDENPDQHPDALEVCNLFDDNCDGAPDNHPDCPQCVAFESSWGKHYELCFAQLHYGPAREACQLQGGDLAIVDDPVKQEALVEAVLGVWWTDWWIGLDDLEEEGAYTWVNGDPLDWATWADNEPNNSGDEDCMHFASWAGGNWNDIPCDRDLAYICEYDD